MPATQGGGVSYQVWAPEAGQVEVEVAGRRYPLERLPARGGWWGDPAGRAPAEPGLDYTFRVDGGPPTPDPRSPWQPQGVHGPSRVLDHSRFAWRDQGWNPPPLSSAVFFAWAR